MNLFAFKLFYCILEVDKLFMIQIFKIYKKVVSLVQTIIYKIIIDTKTLKKT